MNKKGRVRNLYENKVIILVLYRDLEIALTHCIADSNLYGTGLIEHNFSDIHQLLFEWIGRRSGDFTIILLPRIQDECWIVLDLFMLMTFGVKVSLIINSTIKSLIFFVYISLKYRYEARERKEGSFLRDIKLALKEACCLL